VESSADWTWNRNARLSPQPVEAATGRNRTSNASRQPVEAAGGGNWNHGARSSCQ